jgi:hypothetical protein
MADRNQGLGDGQGTRIGSPEPGRAKETPLNAGATEEKGERARQAPNAGRTTPSQHEEESTGAGAEALEGVHNAGGGHDREHRSGYGGSGGKPVESSDKREPKKP